MAIYLIFEFIQAAVFYIVAQEKYFGRVVHAPVLLLPHVDDVFHIRETFAFQVSALAGLQFRKHGIGHLHKVTVLFAINDTKCMHIRILAKIFQFRLLIIRIYCDVYRTNLGTGIQQCQPIGHVRCPYADMSTTFHPNSDQSFRHIIHTLVQLTPGKTKITVGIYDIFLIGSLFGPMFQPLSKSTFK